MTSIGAEVGQKMRSAIKAKLVELGCYVDDELPDYVMVMVANKRSKSQMKEDLQLFLGTKTAAFVDWLHIVLKKLKEVTVTNPEAYKKTGVATKRRVTEEVEDDPTAIKKESKKEKKSLEKRLKTTINPTTTNTNLIDDGRGISTTSDSHFGLTSDSHFGLTSDSNQYQSLTDDLPINANKLAEQRKIVIMKENNCNRRIIEDNFDIPLLSEVNKSSEKELEDIERKIKSVKSRLGLLIDSDSDSEFTELPKIIKTEPNNSNTDDRNPKNQPTNNNRSVPNKIRTTIEATTADYPTNTNEPSTKIQIIEDTPIPKHTRITFNDDNNDKKTEDQTGSRKSILERLGEKRKRITEIDSNSKRNRLEFRPNSDSELRPIRATSKKESVLNRLGVMSKVSVVPTAQKTTIESSDEDSDSKGPEVPSMIKIKPRVIPPDTPQANKNLLLKAVAEAQKSIAQTPTVGNNRLMPDALFTKRYKEKMTEKTVGRKLSEVEKNKIKKFLVSVPNRTEFEIDSDVPKLSPKRIPTTVKSSFRNNQISDEKENGSVNSPSESIKQKFIITLDGIDQKFNKEPLKDCKDQSEEDDTKPIKQRKSPSPIIFDKIDPEPPNRNNTKNSKAIANIPDKLPIIHAPSSIKNKERCKYWPMCRQGDKCEFVHPTINCELFPQCKYGDKCLYLHPSCKFGSSCTRRDCPYLHLLNSVGSSKSVATGVKLVSSVNSYPKSSSSASTSICKFFPNCTNVNCTFYHPKTCKFGKYCKNQNECSFLHHDFVSSLKSNLIWRSK